MYYLYLNIYLGQIKLISVTSSPGNPYQYSWSVTGSVDQIGSSNVSNTHIEAVSTGWGNFKVKSRNTCGYSAYGGGSVNVSRGGGGGQMFSVMPNPSSSYIDIELPFKEEQGKGEKVEVSIFNDKSAPVYSKTYTQSSFKINTQTLPEGLYYLQVVYKENLYSQQILIKR